jgi:hypothetical protein
VGHDKLRVGSKVPVAIRLSIRDGWHVQAKNPSRVELTATRFRLLSDRCGEIQNEKYPEPERMPVNPGLGLGEELSVYGGEVFMGGHLMVSKDLKPGKHLLRFEVLFQACSRKNCLAPQHVSVSEVLEFVSGNGGITEKHCKVFYNIGLH